MSIKSWIVKKAVEQLMNKLWDWMQGKKIYVGGIALILTGIGEILFGYSNHQGFSSDGWEKIMAGWLAIGAKSALTKKNPEPLTVPPTKA